MPSASSRPLTVSVGSIAGWDVVTTGVVVTGVVVPGIAEDVVVGVPVDVVTGETDVVAGADEVVDGCVTGKDVVCVCPGVVVTGKASVVVGVVVVLLCPLPQEVNTITNTIRRESTRMILDIFTFFASLK
ncbi:MAG: hypothetical protein WCS64_04370 [Dehalococcoidales bacterium]